MGARVNFRPAQGISHDVLKRSMAKFESLLEHIDTRLTTSQQLQDLHNKALVERMVALEDRTESRFGDLCTRVDELTQAIQDHTI